MQIAKYLQHVRIFSSNQHTFSHMFLLPWTYHELCRCCWGAQPASGTDATWCSSGQLYDSGRSR